MCRARRRHSRNLRAPQSARDSRTVTSPLRRLRRHLPRKRGRKIGTLGSSFSSPACGGGAEHDFIRRGGRGDRIHSNPGPNRRTALLIPRARDVLGVVLVLALEGEKLVIAAATARKIAADRRPRFINRAAALFRIEEAANP